MYRSYRPPSGGKKSRLLEMTVGLTVILLIGWSLFGAPDHSHPPVVLRPTSELVNMPLTEASQMWPSSDGEFGAEGAVATMLGGYPSPIQTPTMLVIMDDSANENPAVRAVSSVLKRWSERVKRKVRVIPSLFPDKVPPTVAVISPCDHDKQTMRRFTGCDDCSSSTLDSKITKLHYDAVKGPLLLIPSDHVNEGLVLMNKVFNYYPGDLLYRDGGVDTKKSCPGYKEGELYNLAVSSMRKRIESYSLEFQPHLSSFTSALAALPNYCEGMYAFSQCQLMNGGDWQRRIPVKPADVFNCSFVASQVIEEPAAEGDKATRDAAKALINTAWPSCVNNPNGHLPKHGIAFVKTFKTKSSIVESVLRRLCLTRRQRCFTHSSKFVNLAYPEQASYVAYPHKAAPALSAPYEMFIAHTMNTPELVNEIVPGSEGHILSIVREPTARFKAHWNYWLAPTSLVADGYPWTATELDAFCVNVTDDENIRQRLSKVPLNIRPALNNMARQLMGCTNCGTPEEEKARFNKLIEAIKAPDSKYHIMITEKLHESLMLVRRDYGLEMIDMVYDLPTQVANKAVTQRLAGCLKNLNSLDAQLYEAVLEVHDARVAALGSAFQEEVAEFTKLVETVTKGCSDEGIWKCKRTSSALCNQCISMRGKADTDTILVNHFKACKSVLHE